MSRLKRSSTKLAKAQKRATNLKSIDEALDVGSGLTLVAFQGEIDTLQGKLDKYNNLLGEIDALNNDILAGEKALAALSERMLDGVGVKFGKDSNEYEKAGGVRKSERRKPTPRPKTA
jgi:hypothetical protein